MIPSAGAGPEARHPTPPRVSVVMPTARGGAYLREAVRSVLAQSMHRWELVVVADGCPEDLEELEHLDPRIRVVRQERRGESIARNVGVRATRTDLIAFLDDDDRMLPHRLERQADVLESDPAVGLCHTQFRLIDPTGAAICGVEGSPSSTGHAGDVTYRDLLRGQANVLFGTSMIRRSVLEAVGTFDSALVTGQDLEVVFNVARASRLHFLPQVLTEYRRHATNVSGDARADAETYERLLRRHLVLATTTGDLESVEAARAGIRWARRYAATGSVLEARRAWRRGDLRHTLGALTHAASLSPAETLRDVVGNRRPVSAVRRRLPARSPVPRP